MVSLEEKERRNYMSQKILTNFPGQVRVRCVAIVIKLGIIYEDVKHLSLEKVHGKRELEFRKQKQVELLF